jgi:hypothetical protein
MINITGVFFMISKIAFSGRRIFDNYKTIDGPVVQKTSVEEDVKDLSEFTKHLSAVNPKTIVIKRDSNSSLPTLITDKYSFSTSSNDRFELKQLYIKDLKENITRAFSSDSESHSVRVLFRDCLQFIRNCIATR